MASADCFDDEKSSEFVGDCVRGLVGRSFCFNEAIVEWRPSGEQVIKLTRGCRTAEWEDRCDPTSDSGYQRTDCHVTVENTDNPTEPSNLGNLDDLWKVVNADQNNVTECNSCYGEGKLVNGEEQGDDAFELCRHGKDVPSMECPEYARRACYSVEALSEDLRPGEQADVSYRRGCSHFELDESQLKCNAYLDGLKNAEACKEACTEDNCNDQEIEIPQNCYDCDYLWDDQGTLGTGDPRCRTGVLGSMVVPCEADQPYCVTERIAEWTHRGKQEHRIKRYCSSQKYEPKEGDSAWCTSGGLTSAGGTSFNFKDCYTSCDDSTFCNKGLEVEEMFSHPNQVKSCKNCFYDEENSLGEKKCQLGSEVSSMQCPDYANAGCFTTASWHQKVNVKPMLKSSNFILLRAASIWKKILEGARFWPPAKRVLTVAILKLAMITIMSVRIYAKVTTVTQSKLSARLNVTNAQLLLTRTMIRKESEIIIAGIMSQMMI